MLLTPLFRWSPPLLLCIFAMALGMRSCHASPVADCRLMGGWDCFQGNIVFISFGEDEDDDRFEFVGSYGTSGTGATCDVYQTGTYVVEGTEIVATFTPNQNGDACFISGANPSLCQCTNYIKFDIHNSCSQITGPSNEFCIPAVECGLEEYQCAWGTPITNPYYQPQSNGCGPSTLPFTAPSFSFEHCCNAHDICYGECTTKKLTCDNEFYQCMACSCQSSYDNGSVTQEICLRTACMYHHLVQSAGCDAYQRSQKRACLCPSSFREYLSPYEWDEGMDEPDKFGSPSYSLEEYESRLAICTPPFTPQCS